MKDASAGAPLYFWNINQVPPEERSEQIRNGWASIGKVFIIAIVLDSVFQYLVSNQIAIVGSIVVATILAILPCLFLRGALNRWKSRPTN